MKMWGGRFDETQVFKPIDRLHIQEDIRGWKAQGLREGREEGIKQEKLNTAKKLLQKGMTLSEVAEITGLSPAEIEGIR